MEPEDLLHNLKVRLGELKVRKKKLNQIIVPPKVAAGILGGVFAEYLAWLAYDNNKTGLAWFVGFYGLLLGIWGALALVDVVASWFGFPKKEYEELGNQIPRLEVDIQKVGRYVSAIEEIQQLQLAASPSQNTTLTGHIETLKKGTTESFIKPYDSSAYEHIRRSVGAIRGYIKRSQAETKPLPIETSGGRAPKLILPIEKRASPPEITPRLLTPASKGISTLADLMKWRKELDLRKSKLKKNLLFLKWMAALLVVIIAVIVGFIGAALGGGWQGLAALLIIWGGLPALTWAPAHAAKHADRFGFPKKEFDLIDWTIQQIDSDARRIERFEGVINTVRELKANASPSESQILDRHLLELAKALARSPIPNYDTSEFSTIDRSIAMIRYDIEVRNLPKPEPTILPKAEEKIVPKTPTSEPPSPPKPTPTLPGRDAPHSPSHRAYSPSPKEEVRLSPTTEGRLPTEAKATPEGSTQKPASAAATSFQKPEKIYSEPIDPPSTELDISKAFTPRPTSFVKKIIRTKGRHPIIKGVVDYLEQYIRNQDIGQMGENFVLKSEKDYLLKNNRNDLADQVVRASLDNDSLGYDILSFDLTGAKKYIEVKTTNMGYESQFFLSANEERAMKALPNYHIYRIYDFDRRAQTGSIYKVDCAKEFDKFFRLETAVYKVSPNIGD